MGVAVLGEPLDGRMLVAFALVLGGSWLATSRSRLPVTDPTV